MISISVLYVWIFLCGDPARSGASCMHGATLSPAGTQLAVLREREVPAPFVSPLRLDLARLRPCRAGDELALMPSLAPAQPALTPAPARPSAPGVVPRLDTAVCVCV